MAMSGARCPSPTSSAAPSSASGPRPGSAPSLTPRKPFNKKPPGTSARAVSSWLAVDADALQVLDAAADALDVLLARIVDRHDEARGREAVVDAGDDARLAHQALEARH